MRNLLVTGGAGFIGSNYIRHTIEANPSVNIINLDLLTYAGNISNLDVVAKNPRYSFVQGDIRDGALVEKIFVENEVDTVVHFAAESHVDRSIHTPSNFIETNIVGTFTLLEAALKAWKDTPDGKLFHHVSTDEVFGSLEPSAPAFSETTAYDPRSPYSASKASSDHLVRAYAHTYGLPISISNCSNNYGPFQYPEKLIPVVIQNCLTGKPIPVYGDGLQIRDWIYVIDHCEAINRVLKARMLGQTYNIGGDNQVTNMALITRICEIFDQRLPDSPNKPHKQLITHVKDRPGHDRKYAMNIDKITHDLGWKPSVDLETGLAKTVDWYISNQDWVNDLLEKSEYEKWNKVNYKDR